MTNDEEDSRQDAGAPSGRRMSIGEGISLYRERFASGAKNGSPGTECQKTWKTTVPGRLQLWGRHSCLPSRIRGPGNSDLLRLMPGWRVFSRQCER